MAFLMCKIIPIGPEFTSKWYGYLISNIIVVIITQLLSKIPYIKLFIISIIKWHNKNEKRITILYTIFSMIILLFFLYNNFINILPNQLLLITNLFCVAVLFFIVNFFKEKANNNRIISEYDQLIGYVQKYEKVVEDKSKNQHEYKNQLVMIKSMINKSNKKAINYIDSLYNESKDDNDIELLKKLKYLPSGGLKGLIYYKIEEMQEKGINVFVDISSELKNVKVDKKIDKNLKDISKVIGVYMDNAIEAAINSKEKYTVLEVYLREGEWVFSLSNTYSNKVNLTMVDQEGYTTKGEGKGYGLSLVKDIIEHNKDLRQERELNGIYYTQRLYMKK
ncbi:MAG: GHKL domain-containing protein [Bacilli bacterium]|nr:GHKL domain-containing protein [Bacilli bacterium]